MAECATCGFLAVLDPKAGALDGCGSDYRENGELEYRDTAFQHHRWPICFVSAFPLRKEVRDAMDRDGVYSGDASSVHVVEVLKRNRDECPGFTPWRQGFTPKEHQEMLDRQWRLEFQAQREEADRQWRDQQRKADLEWREEQRRRDLEWRERESRETRKWHWRDFWAVVIATGLIVAGASVAGAWLLRTAPPNTIVQTHDVVVPAPQVNIMVPPPAHLPTPSPQTPG